MWCRTRRLWYPISLPEGTINRVFEFGASVWRELHVFVTLLVVGGLLFSDDNLPSDWSLLLSEPLPLKCPTIGWLLMSVRGSLAVCDGTSPLAYPIGGNSRMMDECAL